MKNKTIKIDEYRVEIVEDMLKKSFEDLIIACSMLNDDEHLDYDDGAGYADLIRRSNCYFLKVINCLRVAIYNLDIKNK